VSPSEDPRPLLAELFDLNGWAGRANDLIAELEESGPTLAGDLAGGFVLAAAALRHLVSDPLLPDELAPDQWPAGPFRSAYAAFVATYQAGLREFFRARLASG